MITESDADHQRLHFDAAEAVEQLLGDHFGDVYSPCSAMTLVTVLARQLDAAELGSEDSDMLLLGLSTLMHRHLAMRADLHMTAGSA